ncbi:MAG: hypothetical protein K2M97_05540, partial [Muribaculaceae bacterium]|nr:hypothetical protein [Muribaculaceae bacterium]
FPGNTMQSRLSPKWWSSKHGYTSLRLLDITENSTDGTVSFRLAGAPTRPETGEPWSVDCAIALASDGDVDDVTVTGHVVGYCRSSTYGYNSAVFKGGSITGNVLLADSPDETDWSNCIPVQLTSGSDARAMLNLKENPDMLGAKVSITGKLGTYLSARAMCSITDVKIDRDESSIGSIEADGDDTPAIWFDLSGRRVPAPVAPGVYVNSRGEKIIL